MARVDTGACLLHSACVRAVRCSAWIVRAVVYLECVCVCVRRSVCVARLVSLVQRFVCQRGSRVGTSCWYLFVQCFAWSAKRGQMCLVCPTPCAVRLGITGAEHTRPCWCPFRTGQMCLACPILCAVRLGITGAERTRPCWCLFRTGSMCLVCPTLCAVRLGITGAEPTRPCWCFVLVSLSYSASLDLYSA